MKSSFFFSHLFWLFNVCFICKVKMCLFILGRGYISYSFVKFSMLVNFLCLSKIFSSCVLSSLICWDLFEMIYHLVTPFGKQYRFK